MRMGNKMFPIFCLFGFILVSLHSKTIKMKNKIKRSQLFWLPVYTIGLVITGIISIKVLLYVLAIGSVLTIAVAMEDKIEDNLWIILMPITWFCCLTGVIVLSATYLYDATIGKFNRWLDRDKTKKMNE